VPDAAIHEGSGIAGGWRMAGFRATKRSLVCFLDENVEISARSSLEALVQTLEDTDADLVAPRLRGLSDAIPVRPATVGLDRTDGRRDEYWRIRSEESGVVHPSWLSGELLLVRREVILATGGFDDCYVPSSLQDVDFCIQARRRGFSCVEISVAGMTYRGPLDANWNAMDVSALRSKWRSHTALLEP
jgi:GT2 family glycosyltransferase